MTNLVKITPAASAYINKMVKKDNGIGFRLSVKKTGCSGYSYYPQVIATAVASDQVEEIDGVSIYIDTSWLHLLRDVEIDYVEEDKSGLKQKRLVFTNPNESSRCGCGESFHVE